MARGVVVRATDFVKVGNSGSNPGYLFYNPFLTF